jgi:threonine/homoserine/homoserine lactone efflux protein
MPARAANLPGEDTAAAGSDFSSTLLLTLTNPTTILSFLAVLAGLGMGGHRSWWLTFLLVAGIFCGSMLWWVTLVLMVNRFRDRFDRHMRAMNRIAGLAIGGFGVVTFFIGLKHGR